VLSRKGGSKVKEARFVGVGSGMSFSSLFTRGTVAGVGATNGTSGVISLWLECVVRSMSLSS
jgi:hypothetical protein